MRANTTVRDLIPHPQERGHMIVVAPEAPLTDVCRLMREHDISQLPVIQGRELIGILDESDVLLHVYGDDARFRDPASSAMVTRLDRIDVNAPVEALLPMFERGQVAIVIEGERFVGLVTRIDLLNYLRRRVR